MLNWLRGRRTVGLGDEIQAVDESRSISFALFHVYIFMMFVRFLAHSSSYTRLLLFTGSRRRVLPEEVPAKIKSKIREVFKEKTGKQILVTIIDTP